MIMRQFKFNAKGDSLLDISGDESSTLMGQGKKDAGPTKHHTPPTSRSRSSSDPPPTKTSTPEYHLRYIGSMEISPSSVSQNFMDDAVGRFRKAYAKRQKAKKKKRKLSKTQSHSSGSSLDSIDFPISIKAESQSGSSEHSESSGNTLSPRASLAGTERSQSPRREDCEVTVEITRSTPEKEFTEVVKQDGSSQEESTKVTETKELMVAEPMAEEVCEQVGQKEENGKRKESNITKPTPNEVCEQVVKERERQPSTGDEPRAEKTVASGLESKQPSSLYTEEVTFMMGADNIQEDNIEGDSHEGEVVEEEIVEEEEEEEEGEEEEEASGSPATVTAAVCKRALTVVPSGEMEGKGIEDDQDTENGASTRFLSPDFQPGQGAKLGERELEETEERERKAEKKEEGEEGGREEVDTDEYDILPELDSLYDSTEFRELGKQKDLTGIRWQSLPHQLDLANC